MEFIVAIGTSIVGKISEYTVAPVGRQLGYLFCYTSNVDNLKTQVRQLKNKKERLLHRIDAARRNGEEIEFDIQDWMEKADCKFENAETFLKDDCHAKAGCSCGSFPSLVSRHQLSRKAKKMTDEIASVVEVPDNFATISYPPRIESSIELFTGYEAFETRKKVLMEVMEALRDPNNNVRMIGVYGMGGIGKTVLAKEVMRQAKKEKLFSELVMTSISQTPNIKEIQQDIADKLGLKFEVESINRRADELRNRLKQEKKILLVLDDIWSKIELLEIGIHFEDVQSACKILLTSRSEDVVCRDMGVQKIFRLDPLSSEEAKKLFEKSVGVIVEQNFRSLALKLVKECAGLPIAIVTVASALKNKTESIWNDALLQLQCSNPTNIEGMPEKVYSSIRLSYDLLGSEEAKSLLLLCSLHGEDEDIEIDHLIRYSAGWGLFEDITTLEESRNRVNSLVDRLKSRCLLLVGDDSGKVKMHDVIRDVSIFIAAKERHMYCLSDVSKLMESKKKLKDSKAISVVKDDNVGQLPERLESPHLELLVMRCSSIPENFFEETKELKTLVLNINERTEFLPSCFHSLQNLRSLCLRYSKLKDVDLVGDLMNLKILDLSNTSVCQLTEKIGQLSHLQLLDLRGTMLKVIQPNVLSRLVRLEELYMPEKFKGWEVEEGNTERRNASLIEMKNLRHLTTLYLHVPNIKMFPNERLFGEKLQRYQIHMGNTPMGVLVYFKKISRSLVLRDCERSQLNALGLEAMMRRSEQLSLDRILGVKNSIVYELDKQGFPQLKHLKVLNCEGVEYIVNVVDQNIHPFTPFFRSLETLHLGSLANLEKICHGVLTADSFNKLREVSVKNCGKLKNLFPMSIARRLHVVDVGNCEMMEEIVALDQREDEVGFDELCSLRLQSLPKFVHLIRSPQLGVTTGSTSIESPNYPLFDEKVALPKLEKLMLYEMDVKNLWPDQLLSVSNYDMQSLSQLEVCECNNLKHLSSFAVANKSFVKLQMLEVRNCSSLEKVFIVTKKQDGDNQDRRSLLEKLSFSQLQTLKLHNLPNLKTFCATLVDEEEPFFNDTVEFSGLEHLSLSKLNVESLWPDIDHKLLATTSFLENLKELYVESCNKLKYLFTLAMAERLVKLESLSVLGCHAMEDIIATKKNLGGEHQRSSENILFPKLKSLSLMYIPALKRLCVEEDYCIQLPSSLIKSIEHCPESMTFVDNQEENQLATKPFFHNKVEFSGLECMALFGLNFESLWPDIDHKLLATTSLMENLKELDFNSCHKLKYLFTLAMAERLVKLERLVVDSCHAMEDIIVTKKNMGREDQRSSKMILFSKLKLLTLIHLPALKRFCVEDDYCIQLPSSLRPFIHDCPELKTFVDNQEENSLATKPLFNKILLRMP